MISEQSQTFLTLLDTESHPDHFTLIEGEGQLEPKSVPALLKLEQKHILK